MKAFFKEKGLYLLCLALVFGVTVVGVMAVRSVVNNVADLTQARQRALEEDSKWDGTDMPANKTEEGVPVTETPQPTAQPSGNTSAQDTTASAGASPTQSPSSLPQQSDGQAGASGAGSSYGPASKSGVTSAGSANSGTSGASSASAPVSSAGSEPPAQPYSGQELVYNATLGDWRTHNGTDYAAKSGESVYAVSGGEVTAVYEDALWGGVIEVKAPNGVQWKYCGVADPRVKQGDTPAAGAQLGTVGSIPAEGEAAPHLHLECSRDGDYINPETATDQDPEKSTEKSK